MAKFFKRRKKDHLSGDKKMPANKPVATKTDTRDLIDPVLYTGGLDEDKYPFLALENDKKIKPEEEVENPLNKR